MRPPVVELTAHAVVAETVVFRIVRGASPQDPEVVAGFHSNYHRGFDPRGAEVTNALVHMGLSTYRTSERAAAIARRWPRIGDHIAVLRLRPEHGMLVRGYRRARAHHRLGKTPAVARLCGRYPSCRAAMTYTLMASTGNMIDWFDNEPEPRAALQRIVESDPAAADDVALFISDDDGNIVDGPIHAVPASVS
jgi:hypothetical protein